MAYIHPALVAQIREKKSLLAQYETMDCGKVRAASSCIALHSEFAPYSTHSLHDACDASLHQLIYSR